MALRSLRRPPLRLQPGSQHHPDRLCRFPGQGRSGNRQCATCASSELRLTFAPISHAICSVAAMERALSNSLGMRVTNFRTVFRSHASAQLSDNTSVLARYLDDSDSSAAPPKICPAVSQCRRIFRPPPVNTKCLPRPLVRRKSRSAGSSSWRITEERRNRRCLA